MMKPLRIALPNGATAYVHEDREALLRWVRRAREQRRIVISVDGRALPLDRLEDALAQATEATR
jgi:hypothetical protein